MPDANNSHRGGFCCFCVLFSCGHFLQPQMPSALLFGIASLPLRLLQSAQLTGTAASSLRYQLQEQLMPILTQMPQICHCCHQAAFVLLGGGMRNNSSSQHFPLWIMNVQITVWAAEMRMFVGDKWPAGGYQCVSSEHSKYTRETLLTNMIHQNRSCPLEPSKTPLVCWTKV